MEGLQKKKKTRLIVKKGSEHIALDILDIALFYTKERTVWAVDKACEEYLLCKNLSEIMEGLDESVFFRANRQQLININFIKSFRAHENVKLMIGLKIPAIKTRIIISQEVAPVFKKWLCES